MDFQDYARSLTRNRNRRTAGLIVVEQVESTLLLGRRVSDEYIREGTVPPDTDLVAWHQRSGRGRHGRTWSSPGGQGIYATLIRRVDDRTELSSLPLRVAVALCQALDPYLDGRCRLKWPNDLRVGEKKLGGILIEILSLGEAGAPGEQIALIAFGVNHTAEAGVFGEPEATSFLAEASSSVSLAELAAQLLAAVDAELVAASPEVLERYRRYSVHRPGDVIVHRGGADGEGVGVEGRFVGFDDRGFLRLDVNGEERTFSAGEVTAGGAGD